MKKIPKIYKFIIGAVLLLLILSFINPGIAKKLYKRIMAEYEVIDKKLVKELDSLKSVRRKDSIRYVDALKIINEQYELEIDEANKKYSRLNKKYWKNAKELDDYRNSNFDGKFELFSIAVIGKDSIQGQ